MMRCFPKLQICNELDDDCDGEIDEDLFSGLFYDADGDGHGDPDQPSLDCQASEGFVYYADDCDDTDPTIYPFSDELCDGIDNDCDGTVDEGVTQTFYADTDKDGFGDLTTPIEACSLVDGIVSDDTDCDDSDAQQYPQAIEYCNDEDDNCDGDIDEDNCRCAYLVLRYRRRWFWIKFYYCSRV